MVRKPVKPVPWYQGVWAHMVNIILTGVLATIVSVFGTAWHFMNVSETRFAVLETQIKTLNDTVGRLDNRVVGNTRQHDLEIASLRKRQEQMFSGAADTPPGRVPIPTEPAPR